MLYFPLNKEDRFSLMALECSCLGGQGHLSSNRMSRMPVNATVLGRGKAALDFFTLHILEYFHRLYPTSRNSASGVSTY